MSSKVENLLKHLQSLQQFINARVDRYPILQEIVTELAEISMSLKRANLTIGIYSQFSIPAQGLYSLFNTSQALSQFYQIENLGMPPGEQSTYSSPAPQARSVPSVTLQANNAVGQPQTQYELAQNLLIGREHQNLKVDFRSQGAVLVALPHYRKISSIHALISPTANADINAPNWQICDLGSTNGTYINGQKITNCQILKPGDRITLAYPAPSEKAPEFIFEQPTNTTSSGNNSDKSTIPYDLICLVINPRNELSTSEKNLINALNPNKVSGLIIIADISGISNQESQSININLSTIKTWINENNPALVQAKKLDIAPFLLSPFYPQNINISDPNLQKTADSLCQSLINLAKIQSENIISSRYSVKLSSTISSIENALNTFESSLARDARRAEEQLSGKTVDDLRRQVSRVFTTVGDEKSEFFSRVRSELARSKSDSFNPFTQDESNILHKIRTFVDNLPPVVTRQGGEVCIQLQPEDGANTHHAVVQFCKLELSRWVIDEWWRICNAYGGEQGLNGLHKKSYVALNCLPSLSLSNPFSEPSELGDIQKNLDGSFREVLTSNSYYEGSSSDMMLNSAARVAIQGMSALGIAAINPFSAAIQGASAAAGLASLVGQVLNRSKLDKYKEHKLEEIVVNTKLRASSYYQSLTEYLLGRLLQDTSMALEKEERKFNRALASINEQMYAYLEDTNRCLNEYKNQQMMINQDRALLEKIKHF